MCLFKVSSLWKKASFIQIRWSCDKTILEMNNVIKLLVYKVWKKIPP